MDLDKELNFNKTEFIYKKGVKPTIIFETHDGYKVSIRATYEEIQDINSGMHPDVEEIITTRIDKRLIRVRRSRKLKLLLDKDGNRQQ